MPDVVVVGGGVIGTATAWFCAVEGLSVTLLERATLAAGASGRNQGLLLPPREPELATIGARSLDYYLELHEASRSAAPFDLDLADHGCLVVGDAEASGGPAAEDVDVTHLDGEELRRCEPLLGPGVERASLVPSRRVDPGGLVAAMAVEARRLGARIRTAADVKDLLFDGERVVGVVADDGVHRAETTVLAGGPWTSRLARRLPGDVPVRGGRGWIALTARAPFRLRHAISDAAWRMRKAGLPQVTMATLASERMPLPLVGGSLLQDHHGRVLVGASLQPTTTEEPDGHEALGMVARRAVELVPALASVPIVETRTCRRPVTPDGLPLHGPVPGVEGVLLACGHGSQGISLGAGAGEAIAGGIVSERWDPALLPGRPTLDSLAWTD